jgi:hypothetical protein
VSNILCAHVVASLVKNKKQMAKKTKVEIGSRVWRLFDVKEMMKDRSVAA